MTEYFAYFYGVTSSGKIVTTIWKFFNCSFLR